jgi:tetratricopeptide (TPR) repeat protein
MIMACTKSILVAGLFAALLALSTPLPGGQTAGTDSSVIQGSVYDSQDHPLAGVAISLQGSDPSRALVTKSDERGQFRFALVPDGSYTLQAKLPGYEECTKGPFALPNPQAKSMVLRLTKPQGTAAIAFSDEPAFTVAGVTDTTALGGHGSGPIVRNSNALSKETASLARGEASARGVPADDSTHAGPEEEAAIRAKLAQSGSADLHAQLAEVEEAEGHPLEAVKEYQRAAEMQPSEPHLFAWGAELLLHHAPEPAIEVFSKGHRLFPQSSRMMLGLGAAWYAQRSKEPAEQIFLQACDLHPGDPIPYLFLGRLQALEQTESAEWMERMKRFATLHPESAMAHYLYGVALLKQSAQPDQTDTAEAELHTALRLDPHLGEAYLQMGILLLGREDFPAAIAALENAVENTPLPDDAHYRLAQAYRRTGEVEKARQEIELFKKLSEQKNQQTERERHEIPQFVYTLRGQNATPPSTKPDPN